MDSEELKLNYTDKITVNSTFHSDPTLSVIKQLPDGVEEIKSWGGDSYAYSKDGESWHYCPSCDGWIQELAFRKYHNSLNPRMRSGRRGYAYHCRRCGDQLSFVGMRS